MKTVVSAATNSASSAAANVNTSTASGGAVKADSTEAAANLPFQTPNTSGNTNKRPISLDLNKPTTKKQRGIGAPLALDSPDLQSLKSLNTPDLEKILLSSNLLPTPQPGLVFPSKVGAVTSEQEAFGKGFEEALHSLHNSKNSQTQLSTAGATTATNTAATTTVTTTTNGTGMSGGSFTYTNLESTFPVAIKDEPQNPSSSPPVSPIDMETQEKIKLERKRQRNRVAASKCRKRKLERISKLEDKVKILKGENVDLGLVVKNLKDHVAQLKQQVIKHIETGCSIPTMYNGSTVLQGK